MRIRTALQQVLDEYFYYDILVSKQIKGIKIRGENPQTSPSRKPLITNPHEEPSQSQPLKNFDYP